MEIMHNDVGIVPRVIDVSIDNAQHTADNFEHGAHPAYTPHDSSSATSELRAEQLADNQNKHPGNMESAKITTSRNHEPDAVPVVTTISTADATVHHAALPQAATMPKEPPAVMTVADLHSGPGPESLPKELQDASRQETVCDYCGVSYLIYSEVQSLQRQLAASKSELESWKSRIDKYEEMKCAMDRAETEADMLRVQNSELQVQLYEKDAEISRLQSLAALKSDSGVDEQSPLQSLMQYARSQTAAAEAETYQLLDGIRLQGSKLRDIKHDVASMKQMVVDTTGAALGQLELYLRMQIQGWHSSAVEAAHAGIKAEHERALDALRTQCQQLEIALDGSKGDLEKLGEHYRNEAAQLQAELAESNSNLEKLGDHYRDEITQLEEETSTRIQILERQAADAIKERELLQNMLQSKDAELCSAIQDNLGLKAELVNAEANKQTAVDAVRDETAMQIAGMQAIIAQYTELYKQADDRNKEEAQQLISLQRSIQDRDAQGYLLQHQIATITDHAKLLQKTLDEESRSRATAESAFAQLQQELLRVMNDLEQQTMRYHDANFRIQQLTSENTKLTGDNGRLNQLLAAAQKEQQASDDARDNLTLELTTLRTEHNVLVSTKEQIELELQNSVRELSKFQSGGLSAEGADELVKAHDQLSTLRMETTQQQEKIAHLESVIHEECAERTYLLDEVNKLRQSASLPLLSPGDIAAAAKAFVPATIQAQAAALLAGPGPSPSAKGAGGDVHLPKISTGRQNAPSREDTEWAARRSGASRTGSVKSHEVAPAPTSGRPLQGMSTKFSNTRR